MNLRKRAYTTALLLILTLIIGGWASKNMAPAAIDYYYEVADNIKAFGAVYKEINSRYVEDLDPSKFLHAGINGMLNKSLPPFWDQLGEEYRYRLDLSLAEAIKLEKPERIVEELYQTLSNYKSSR